MNKFVKNILNYVPPLLRHELVRRSISLPNELSSDLELKIAETEAELEASFRLVYEDYLPLGYCKQNQYKMRATIYHALPSSTTLIAIDKGQIIGTLTIVRDNRLGLPIDKIFDISALRKKANRTAEITSLVIHKNYRREKGGQILFPLLKLMYEYSTLYFGVNHLVVTIHPKDVHFYKALLLFNDIPGTGIEIYLGAPAIALSIDLNQALLKYQNIYSQKSIKTNVFKFVVEKKLDNIRLPKREYYKINDPVVSLKYFKELFLEKLKLDNKNHLESRRIESILQYADARRMHPRCDIEAPGKLIRNGEFFTAAVRVKDVSRFGLRLYAAESFILEPEFDLEIEIGPNLISNLKVKPIWKHHDKGIGFEILTADAAWHEFSNYLIKDQLRKIA